MRLGVLDIGSNSAQLLVVDARPGAPPLPAHAVKEPTLLGELIEPDGSIAENGVQRVAEAVARAVIAAQCYGVDQLYPFVTAAIRDATNRDEVVERIGQVAGVPPQFLSGQQEARLTYLAVHHWYGWSAGRILMLDIGGGSMEIVLGRDAEPDLAVSLPLGAGRLTRQFLHDDPPAREQVKRLRRHVRDTLGEVADRLRWEGDPRRAVATSKTFKQLARLAGAPPQRKGPFCRRVLTIEDVRDWIPRLAAMPAAKRARLRGVSQPRARQILAGAITAHATMAMLDVAELEVSPWALREGIVLQHLSTLTPLADGQPLPLQPLTRTAGATVTALPQR
jgi:exopolyphosphatase/guanosine-5'-triphosphate,3'-diphosphate pyrophosphatase